MSDGDPLKDRGEAIFAELRERAEQADDSAAPASSPVDPPDAGDEEGEVSDETASSDDDPETSTSTAPLAPRPVQMPSETAAIASDVAAAAEAMPEGPADTDTSTADGADIGVAAAPAAGRRDAAGHPLPRIFAVANQKGGVGKTTTAVNLAAALADAGYRTLVVDLDPQGNASTGLGINIRDLQLSMYDVIIHEASIDDTIEATAMKNLFVAPSSLDLAGAEIELVPAFSRELRLRHALDEVRDQFDYILIDCPPSLGLLTVNGLAAAAEVLVPIQCEYYALEGLGQLLRNVSLVQRNVNQQLQLSTFVCVMYDARTKLADQVVAEVREHFGEKVCRIVIPRTVRLSEAPSYGQPILAFDPRSRGAIAYRELAREVSGGPVEPVTSASTS